MTEQTNRSDVDRLGDIRAEVGRLKAEEAAIKARLLASGGTVFRGEDFVAEVTAHERRSLDTRAMIAWYGEKALGKFMRKSQVTVLRLKERGE